LFDATFVRIDRATGDAVFDIRFPARLDDTSHHRIWISPAHHIVERREWYSQTGQLLATFAYESPRNVSGVWMPTHLTVRNVDNVVAGITRYDSVRVNTGISDDVFVGR
jgi:outer membrane lipoprotein-sorting protein